MLTFQMIDQPGSRRPEPPYPLHLLAARTRNAGDSIREEPESMCVVRLIHQEPAEHYATDPVGAFSVVVLPRRRLAGGGRQHVDIVAFAQLLGEQPAGMLGPRRDLHSVARRDERKLQDATPLVR